MELSRRTILGGVVAGAAAALTTDIRAEVGGQTSAASPARPAAEPFGYCLNTSTIRGNSLDIVAEIAVMEKAGYTAVEPWVNEIDAYVTKGGTLKDLGKRFADAGLAVENVIAFNAWLDDDESRRTASMEKLKVDMDKVAQIGGKRIATPPGQSRNPVTLDNAANYYRAALELGETMGVQPLLELWGTHPLLGPLSHGIYVSVAAGRADASLLLDVFHLYKSGTPYAALRQVNGAALHVVHMNDFPMASDVPSEQSRRVRLPLPPRLGDEEEEAGAARAARAGVLRTTAAAGGREVRHGNAGAGNR
jgi:sugar phosphate isomerase/epimerase